MNISGINQSLQKDNNIALILRLMRKNRGCSRSWLAQKTGLTAASVGKIVSQLIDWGLVVETEVDLSSNEIGRKPVGLDLNADRYQTIAIRINRDYAKIALYDIVGNQLKNTFHKIILADSPEKSMDEIVSIVQDEIRKSPVLPMCIGVSVPGPFNHMTGRVSLMSGSPGWNRIDIKACLEDATGIPTFVEHDANCGALAEMRYGDYPENSNILYVIADKGIGAGLIINGSIYRGKIGYAGELGHTSINVFGPKCECGNRGCLELYASSTAFQNMYMNRYMSPLDSNEEESGAPSVPVLLQRVRENEPKAVEIYKKIISFLAFGVVSTINVFSPSTVVFGDKLTEGGDVFLEVVNETLKEYLLEELYQSLEIKQSSFDDDPMLLGAGVAAFDEIVRKPSYYFKPKES